MYRRFNEYIIIDIKKEYIIELFLDFQKVSVICIFILIMYYFEMLYRIISVYALQSQEK
jgi:hypothetical protein